MPEDLTKYRVNRAVRAAGLVLWLCSAVLATSCDTTEYVLLLDLRAAQPVSEVRVVLSSLDRPQPRFRSAPITVPMDDRDISVAPARIAVEVGGPAALIAHIEGTLASGETVFGTRCYDLSVQSVIEDEVVLVGPLNTLDEDSDGFAADPSVVCQEVTDDGTFRPCDDTDAFVCADDLVADCDDMNPNRFPGAVPQCQDGVDDDCDGDIDEACGDNDGDGWEDCAPGATENCDCNDGDATISPAAAEVCGDTIDQDCNGADEFCDLDGDGFRSDIDCDDNNPLVFPMATETPNGMCDGIDNNCNDSIDEVPECIPADLDGDGVDACEPGATDTSGCDCNDCDQGVHGGDGSAEICTNAAGMGGGNGIDDDCDGAIDEMCDPADMDGDGELPPDDCDDTDPLTRPQPPGWPERCGDGVSQNCVPGAEAARCAADEDSDGWAEPDACEGNADINPDQSERPAAFVADCNPDDDDPSNDCYCDGVDNNCNEMTDEILVVGVNYGCVRSIDGTLGRQVNFINDFQNCGGCRVLCDSQTADRCWDDDDDGFGACDCSDEPGAGVCGAGDEPTCCPAAGCVDIANDVNHCGACGRACGAGEICSEGECRCGSISGGPYMEGDGSDPTACPDPIARDVSVCCSGTCADIRLPDNCGGCGFQCGPNSVCDEDGGFCRCDSTRYRDCNMDLRTSPTNNGCEIDTDTDLAHCGMCNRACAPNNGAGVCNAGVCEIASCSAPFDDCNGGAFDGCEVNTNTNVAHCGTCGDPCGLNEVMSHTCSGGNCGIDQCNTLFGDCNSTPGDGCEVNLRNNTTHCGACNTACGARENCNNRGQCTCPGQGGNGGEGGGPRCTGPGVACCPGSGCEDLDDTNAHCGACDTACGARESCNNRRCVCGSDQGTAAGGEVCTGATPDCCIEAGGCVDTDDDFNHCGGCGNACDSDRADSCSGGNCRCDGGSACAGSDICCSDGCQNTMGTDENNCGGCGVTCSGTCLGGSCCAAGTGCVSGGSCETRSDIDSACGNDGNMCLNCAGMGQVCVGSTCMVCEPNGTRGCAGGEICNATGTACEECFVDAHCGGTHQCVSNQCLVCDPSNDDGCTGSDVCLPDGSMCVECNNSTDCGSGACVGNVCQVCNATTNEGCGGSTPICDGGTQCVQCTGDGNCSGANGQCVSNMCVLCDTADNAGCGGDICVGGTSCVECVDDGDCMGADGECVGNMCMLCDPGDNAGCSGATPVCDSGTSCVPPACLDDDDCTDGTCIVHTDSADNECCGGCVDGMTCRAGTTNSQCGTGGAACVSCDTGESCTGGSCG